MYADGRDAVTYDAMGDEFSQSCHAASWFRG